MHLSFPDRYATALRWLTAAVFAFVFSYYVLVTLHWGVIADDAIMHYVVLLIHHGKLPYSEITDMNMPGAYLTEQWAMAVFGWGDVGWRVYEFFLLAVMAIAGAVVGGRRRWMGGLFAAAFFIAMHGAEGPPFSAERDELMTVLLVAATAALMSGVRRRRSAAFAIFGVLAGLAVSIKPTALLADAALLGLALLVLRRRKQTLGNYMLWGLAGNAIVVAVMVLYLWHYHALAPFYFILRKVLPTYAVSTPHTVQYLLKNLFPERILWVVPFALAAVWLRKRRMDWEQAALLVGAGFGAVSYFMQGKGYQHHRYIFVEFLLLWMGMEFADALRRDDARSRWAGAAGVAVLMLLVLPHYLRIMQREGKPGHTLANPGVPGSQLTTELERDLQQLGGDRLQGKVVCLDLINSCLNALYRGRLVENTSFTGDLLLFSPVETPLVAYYRNRFMDLQRADPADVVVLENQWFLAARSDFAKVDTWPQYRDWLAAKYVNVAERRLPGDNDTQAYRILLRKGSAVLEREQADPLR